MKINKRLEKYLDKLNSISCSSSCDPSDLFWTSADYETFATICLFQTNFFDLRIKPSSEHRSRARGRQFVSCGSSSSETRLRFIVSGHGRSHSFQICLTLSEPKTGCTCSWGKQEESSVQRDRPGKRRTGGEGERQRTYTHTVLYY